MTRPKLKIEKSILDKSIEILTFLLIVVSAIIIGFYYNELPERVPIHFNWPSKDENEFGAKGLLWTSPIICGVIVLALYKLNQYPWVFNYPAEITEKNAPYNYKMATKMLRIIGLIIALICFVLTVTSILNGLGDTTNFEKYFMPLFPVLLIGVPIFYVIIMLIKKKREFEI